MVESIAAVVTAIGVVFAGIQLRAGQLQRYRQFESLYVQRYWSLIDRLSPEALQSKVPYEQLGQDDRKTLAMYVRLCEDQLEMREARAITTWTYRQWRDGMVATSKLSTIRSAIDTVSARPGTPCRHLNKLTTTPGKAYDPLSLGPIRRWLRGLS